jgi:hypothetical protein
MARIHDVVIDASHPASIARFRAAVLDGYQVAPYDEAELARLRPAISPASAATRGFTPRT